MNSAADALELLWVDEVSSLEVSMGIVHPLAEHTLSTYASHNFVIRLKNDTSPYKHELRFLKRPYDEVLSVSHSEDGFETSSTHPFEQMEEQLLQALDRCPDKLHPDHVECIANFTYPSMAALLDHHTEVKTYRDLITDKLRNYSCADESLQSSEPISSTLEIVHDKEVTVNSHVDMEHAKVWSVQDFVTEDECELLMESARPRLERAAVVGEDGQGMVSESRKAQQAAYAVTDSSDPLWCVCRGLNMCMAVIVCSDISPVWDL